MPVRRWRRSMRSSTPYVRCSPTVVGTTGRSPGCGKNRTQKRDSENRTGSVAHGDLLREWVTCDSCGAQWVQGFYNDSPDPELPKGSVVLSETQANLTITALWHALHYLKFVE